MSMRNPFTNAPWLRALLLAGGAAISCATSAGSIEFNVEAPEESGAYSGVANLRGWAVSTAAEGIDHIELSIDGTFMSNIPMGAMRNDVGNIYPEATYPGSSQSGFSMAYNYIKLPPGGHQMTFVAVDADGATSNKTVNFQVIAFDATDEQLQDANAADFSSATFTPSGQSIQVQGMLVQGTSYNATLTWDTESQQFQFKQISKAN